MVLGFHPAPPRPVCSISITRPECVQSTKRVKDAFRAVKRKKEALGEAPDGAGAKYPSWRAGLGDDAQRSQFRLRGRTPAGVRIRIFLVVRGRQLRSPAHRYRPSPPHDAKRRSL